MQRPTFWNATLVFVDFWCYTIQTMSNHIQSAKQTATLTPYNSLTVTHTRIINIIYGFCRKFNSKTILFQDFSRKTCHFLVTTRITNNNPQNLVTQSFLHFGVQGSDNLVISWGPGSISRDFVPAPIFYLFPPFLDLNRHD